MRVTDFSFELPESLIAHYPMPERSSCRLLSLDGPTGALTHGTFTDLLDKLNPGDLLVFNNTRVIPARLFGRKASGGKIEVLVERMLDDKRILAHIRASKAPKPGAELLLGDDESINATMTARHGALFEVEFNDERSVLDILNSIGHMPLPPYIDRPDEDADRELYQTVYSEKPGADLIEPFFDDTQIFIYPGFQYKVVDALVTNFHLPESTLIMLVSAFAGYQHTMNAYKAAVEEKYRFFSYGDAMFITYNPQAINERVGE